MRAIHAGDWIAQIITIPLLYLAIQRTEHSIDRANHAQYVL
jgi:hypothetical protein